MEKLKALATDSRILLAVAISLVLMNFIDGGFSLWAIYVVKVAYEANPLMAALMGVSPYLFLTFKFVVPALGATVLYKYRDYPVRGVKIATYVLWFSFLLYFGLMIHFGLLLNQAIAAGLL